MVQRRLLALCGLVSLSLFYSCTDGSSPVAQVGSGGSASIALSTTFPQGTTVDQVADITRIRVTVKRVSNDVPVGSFVTDVDPNLEVWMISLAVPIPPDNPRVYLVTELLSVLNGVETVEFSGITAAFSLLAQTPVQEVRVVQGPVANNFVTAVNVQPAGSITEGDGIQLQAQVLMSRPGAATLRWTSADPGVATVTEGGFLAAHLPGTARITATAGSQSDEVNVEVLARPIGLAFLSQPNTVEVDQVLDPAPSVEVVDARGDRVLTSTASIRVALQDQSPAAAATPGENEGPQAAPLDGTTTVAAAGGLATSRICWCPREASSA